MKDTLVANDCFLFCRILLRMQVRDCQCKTNRSQHKCRKRNDFGLRSSSPRGSISTAIHAAALHGSPDATSASRSLLPSPFPTIIFSKRFGSIHQILLCDPGIYLSNAMRCKCLEVDISKLTWLPLDDNHKLQFISSRILEQ